MMQLKLIIAFMFIILYTGCAGQNIKPNFKYFKNHGDSIYFDKMLKEYYIDSCIVDVFKAIVYADSSHVNYPPASYFYSIYFSKSAKTKGYQYLSVAPRLWNNSEYMDYKGIIKIEGMTFLCNGDFETDYKFHRIEGKRIRVKLAKNKNDTIGNHFIREPSLQGVYNDCKGLPIYIEVYVKEKIADFEMEVPKK